MSISASASATSSARSNGCRSSGEPSGRREREVLLVDPVRPVRRHVAHLFRRLGFRVFEVSGLAEAAAMAAQRSPALVVTELALPELRGARVVSRLRSAAPGAAIVVCSALAQRDVALAAIQAGAADFLVKPVQVERLGRCLAALGWPASSQRDGRG